jgi:hypothetical protein
MELLGDASWWLPAWLRGALPRINIEEGPVPTPVLQGASAADA